MNNMPNVPNDVNISQARRRNRKKTLPKSRSSLSKYIIYSISLIFFLVSVTYSKSNYDFTDTAFVLLSILSLLLFLVEVALRVAYTVEEYQHLITRYENSQLRLFKDVFYFSVSVSFIAITSTFLNIIIWMRFDRNPLILWYEFGPVSVLFSLLSALFLKENLALKCGPLYDSLWIENSNGLDYGSGLAHSFFHGYLKLVIPKTGTSEKHLEELMKDYEDKHHVKLDFYKLFILIPKSLYCFTSLKDEISPSIEESSSLDPKVITVAGVRDRVYKNSVYKIKSDKGRRVYVCAEYATPLKTFKDVVTYNGEHSNYYKKHKNDIVLQFYLTLQKVLKENENCTNFCELIFYDDKDEQGRYKDVGQILLHRIKKLQRTREVHNN